MTNDLDQQIRTEVMQLFDHLHPRLREIIARCQHDMHPQDILELASIQHSYNLDELCKYLEREWPCEPAPSGRSKLKIGKEKRLDPKSLKSLSDRYFTKD